MIASALGIDIGSTTVKAVVTDSAGQVLFSTYQRHNINLLPTLCAALEELIGKLGDISVRPVFTGSAGMGIAEKAGQPFVQEVVAACKASMLLYPDVKSLIDIGGEDAKLVLFSDVSRPDIRMNGNCAGGTGAYIDQMATLLNIHVSELDGLASASKKIYPVASRCGVFAKTDVQNLISRKIDRGDIAASIFHAVASQTINTLARGCTIHSKVLFTGGPLKYISYLRKTFTDILNLQDSDIVLDENAEIFTAIGTALSAKDGDESIKISSLISLLKEKNSGKVISSDSLPALFSNEKEFADWQNKRNIITIPKSPVNDGEDCFLGIDSGSTTTKITIINSKAELLYSFYQNNNGQPLETVASGLQQFSDELKANGKTVRVKSSAVTGYGEELIKAAFGLDYGLVETVAHFMAAKKIEPDVTFILDIGGQDMKAINIQNNTISNIEINESCSSGCGSFIESFGKTLGFEVSEFAKKACEADAPYDLGLRCTVFMNSKVKQALRDGASIADLSAGLSYSVVKNCLYKVLKLKNLDLIGDNIVIQGGTFRNSSVVRALEILSEKKIVISDMPELMGAYGAALYSLERNNLIDTNEVTEDNCLNLDTISAIRDYTTKFTTCRGCTNNCQISVYRFENGRHCYSGNKCEKIFNNHGEKQKRGENIFEYKKELLFEQRLPVPEDPVLTVGLPRILNMYENFPFWDAFFTGCNIEVILSDESTLDVYKKGNGAIMSDNICFPAKLAHGHVDNLIHNTKVDRIFYPMIVYEKNEFNKSSNSYNCPIVSSYAEVLKSQLIGNEMPFDSPAFNFDNEKLLSKACYNYVKPFGVEKKVFEKAFKNALQYQQSFKDSIYKRNCEILEEAKTNNELVILLASHPYQADKLIHQQVSQILCDLGVNVINEDIAAGQHGEGFDDFHAIAQWSFPNRTLQAAWWVTRQNERNIGFIQLNSFGCGPDSFNIDEIADLVKQSGNSHALIRIDEIASPGSIKLRLRSLVESMKMKSPESLMSAKPYDKANVTFTKEDRGRTILVPWFSDIYSPFVPVIAEKGGLNMVNLPPSSAESVELGIKYANNEVCFPATLVVGDILRALKSNQYNTDEICFGITQTGGQCRATNYIAMIKRAVAQAGYGNVPIVAVADSDSLHNSQPGFELKWSKMVFPTFAALNFSDALSRMYYATVSREVNKGQSARLLNIYIENALAVLRDNDHKELLSLLKRAVTDFNAIPVGDKKPMPVGIVGEIYMKYNSFGQFQIIDWLIENGVEVVIPPLSHFFLQSFVNNKVLHKENMERSSLLSKTLFWIFEALADKHIKRYETVLKGFRYYRPVNDIYHEAELASEIVSLVNQYGEGWLIPGEIASFAQQGVNDVVCLQPFGCIANHIIGKGVEKRIKEIYPATNLLFLDFDYGTSKVNILNRLHFLIQNESKEPVEEL